MTGPFLYDGNRPTGETGTPPAAPELAPDAESLHQTHGLVAIANGPDYCLCGHTWPCDKRGE
jgi:hypothetical protein